ncbi:hypothetical protein F383_10229 [Gossypium arboreum]|uniref:Uncharacterized protein n=1 Tax=Gossypium arboreum TaxID=29729 RepID=A0A0B0PS52_GOSAR|nr:hypothetical protein F383_10229 [Gossypium arboreum]
MSGTCIGIKARASVRHVWDMHRPCEIQASMRASVRPCLGHGVGILTHVRAIEYPIVFQTVQQKCHLISSKIIGHQGHRSHYHPKHLKPRENG